MLLNVLVGVVTILGSDAVTITTIAILAVACGVVVVILLLIRPRVERVIFISILAAFTIVSVAFGVAGFFVSEQRVVATGPRELLSPCRPFGGDILRLQNDNPQQGWVNVRVRLCMNPSRGESLFLIIHYRAASGSFSYYPKVELRDPPKVRSTVPVEFDVAVDLAMARPQSWRDFLIVGSTGSAANEWRELLPENDPSLTGLANQPTDTRQWSRIVPHQTS